MLQTMKRKVLSILVAVVMLFALGAQALANPLKPHELSYFDIDSSDFVLARAYMVGNGGNAKLNIEIDGIKYFQMLDAKGKLTDLAWKNNSTGEYKFTDSRNGNVYVMLVKIQGNKVVDFSLTKNGNSVPIAIQVSSKDVGFHCGTSGGNGRVWPYQYPRESEKKPREEFQLILERMDEKVWRLRNDENLAAFIQAYYGESGKTDDGATTVICPVCGYDVWVSYSNQSGVPDGVNVQLTHMAPELLIKKYWEDKNPGKLKAVFDVYYLGECDEVCEDECDIIHRGDPVPGLSNLSANKKYPILPGTYVVAERAKTGYIVQPDQIITINFAMGRVHVVEFVNVPDNPTPDSGLKFKKMVEGIDILTWFDLKGYNAAAIINDITFNIYKVTAATDIDDPDTWGEVFKDAKINAFTGGVNFGEVPVGKYILEEVLGDIALEVFKQRAPMLIEVFENDVVTGLKGGDLVSTNKTFNKDGVYSVVNNPTNTSGQYILESVWDNDTWTFKNADGNDNQILNIRLQEVGGTNIGTFLSFCANHGSRTFSTAGTGNYIVSNTLSETKRVALAQAYNYIINTFGSLDGWQESAGGDYKRPITSEGSTYAIAQAVTWLIIHDENADDLYYNYGILKEILIISNNHAKGFGYRYDGTMPELVDFDAYVCLNDAILEVMANYKGTKGPIAEVVYLEYPGYANGNPNHIQPQVIPLFGEYELENEPEDPKTPDGGGSFKKELYYDMETLREAEVDLSAWFNLFTFNLFKFDEECEDDGCDGYCDFIGVYKPNAYTGVVTFENLPLGSYVFKEVFVPLDDTFTGDGDALWSIIWAALYPGERDGLYFDVVLGTSPAGLPVAEVVWADSDEDVPTVINGLLCKHDIIWHGQDNLDGNIPNPFGEGWIKYGDCYGRGFLEMTYIPPVCVGIRGNNPEGYLVFSCTNPEDSFSWSIKVADGLDHDWDSDNPFAPYFDDGIPCPGKIVYACTICGWSETKYDLNLWMELLGFETIDDVNAFYGYEVDLP